MSFYSFVVESLDGCISSNTKIVPPCSHFVFLLGERKLSHDQKNGPADSEELEIDELYFDTDRQSQARGKETVNSQKPLTRKEDQMQERHKQMTEMNQCGIHFQAQLQKKELEDDNLPREKEKREESSQRKLCEIGEHAQLQESEEQEVKSKRQLHEIERYIKDAQVEVTGSGFDEGRGGRFVPETEKDPNENFERETTEIPGKRILLRNKLVNKKSCREDWRIP